VWVSLACGKPSVREQVLAYILHPRFVAGIMGWAGEAMRLPRLRFQSIFPI
jgi:hypothetical protein